MSRAGSVPWEKLTLFGTIGPRGGDVNISESLEAQLGLVQVGISLSQMFG